MKKFKKVMIIAGAVLLVLLIAGYFLQKWFMDYSVKMQSKVEIPKPSGKLSTLQSGTDDWPSWKGPFANNNSAFTEIRTDWSEGLKKVWDVDYLCHGKKSVSWACPAISGNRLVVPGRIDQKDYVFCLNPDTGELLWYQSYISPAGNDSFGEGPRATPTIDQERVYTISRGGLLHCWNLLNGSKIWSQDLVEVGGSIPKWGYSGSPVVHGDKLLVNTGNESLLIAFNKFNGEIIWKSEAAPASYTTPVIISVNGIEQVLSLGGQALFSFNLQNGSKIWQTEWSVKNNINICTPVFDEESSIILISSWYGKGIQAIKAAEKSADILWKNNNIEAHHTDPYILDGYIYDYSGMSAMNNGKFKCLDLLTGEEKWSTTEFGSGQFIYVKPYFLSLDIRGNLYLFKADPSGHKLISSLSKIIKTDSARAWSKPVIARGKLYLRYANQLYCYDISK